MISEYSEENKKDEQKFEREDFATLFERIEKEAKGRTQTPVWYRRQLRTMAAQYIKRPYKLMLEQKRDSTKPVEYRDENHLRKFTREGRLFFFQYKAKTEDRLPYYDTFPLVYVIWTKSQYFYGANLHYLDPKRRPLVIDKLKKNKIDIPKACFHLYHKEGIYGFLLDLASKEWQTAINIPVEHFIKVRGEIILPYNSVDVWKETQKTYYNKFKAQRIIKGYGQEEDIKEVE